MAPFESQVANEIYPAEARTLGCGVCLAGGRLAAMLGPLFFEGQLGPELGWDLGIYGIIDWICL